MRTILIAATIILLIVFLGAEALAETPTPTATATATMTPTPTQTPGASTGFGSITVGDSMKPAGSAEKDIYFESGGYLDGDGTRLITNACLVADSIEIDNNLSIRNDLRMSGDISGCGAIGANGPVSGRTLHAGAFSSFEVNYDGEVRAERYHIGSAYIDYNFSANRWEFYDTNHTILGHIPSN